MEPPNFSTLQAALSNAGQLSKPAIQTAQMAWDNLPSGTLGIRYLAGRYRGVLFRGETPRMVRLGINQTSKLTAVDVEAELRVLANQCRQVLRRIDGVSPLTLSWIAEAERGQGPFYQEWFHIPGSWMGQSEINWDTHQRAYHELRDLALCLEQMSHTAGLVKQGQAGLREESSERQSKDQLLGCLLLIVRELGRPDLHVRQIGKIIHNWAVNWDQHRLADGKWGVRSVVRKNTSPEKLLGTE